MNRTSENFGVKMKDLTFVLSESEKERRKRVESNEYLKK